MLDWNNEGSDDGHGSDNNDDDDDRPSGDGFDSNNDFYSSPEQDPRRGSSKDRGGDDSGASGGQPPNDGYFQFQLSQRGESGTKQHIQSTDDKQPNQQRQQLSDGKQHQHSSIECSFQDQDDSSRHGATNSSIVQTTPASPKQYVPTTTNDKNAVAGDAVTRSITDELQALPQLPGLDSTLLGDGISHIIASNAECDNLIIGMNSACEDDRLQSIEDDDPHLTDIIQARPKTPPLQGTTAENVLSARLRDAHSPGVLLESKVLPPSWKVVKKQQLTVPQSLQNISITPQSFLSVKFLGTGGFSTVDEVVHRDTNLRLGRKTLKNRDQSALEEIRKEVDVLQKLRHPHVIRFLGAYANGDKMSILVSPVADTTLALWLDRFADHKPANLAETVVKMFGCLASSVRYLHEQRPVVKHMDIKPQNILIVGGDQEFPHVVLCDFGISSADEMPDGQAKPVTRQYIAPEVFDGLARQQAADIWSLGCVLAEMASVPFSQDNAGWLSFRKAFNGRTGKHYWQDVPGLQLRLSGFLEEANTATEQTVVRALKSMLSAEPAMRPNAAALTMIFSPAPCCLEWPNDKVIFPGPHEELGAVEMLALEGSVDCCTQLHHSEVSEAESSLSRAKCWLDDCSHNHDVCRDQMPSATKVLPTRLVDVLPDGQPSSYVRVIDSTSIKSSLEDIDYIALSHAWNENHVTLNSEWLQEKSTELQLQTLPTAVNTAISAAQELGHRYIWVDSLCVLQDSEHDKQQECATMASTFRNATMTMVLDQMTTDGVGVDGNLSKQDIKSHYDLPQDQRQMPSTISVIDFATPGFAWDTRAWALQERLLSRRFLHLGEQMYWECNSLKASETFPRGLSPLVWEKVHSKSPTDLRRHTTATIHRTSNPFGTCRSDLCQHQRHRSFTPRLPDSQLIQNSDHGISDNMSTTPRTLKSNNADLFSPSLVVNDHNTEPTYPCTVSAQEDSVTIDNVKSKIHSRPLQTCIEAGNTSTDGIISGNCGRISRNRNGSSRNANANANRNGKFSKR